MPAPFVQHAGMTAVAVAWRQGNLIADEVLHRVPVDNEKFTYNIYNKEDGFTVPETLVGRKGKPNEVEFGSSEGNGRTQDHGLDTPVPNADVTKWEAEAKMGNPLVDPRLRATRLLTQCVATRREKRVADLVFNANSYAADNKKILSGASMWSDYDNSDPETDIARALSKGFMRYNLPVFGNATWTWLSRHPKLAMAILGRGTERGKVTRQQFSEYFEMSELPVVGMGWLNTAKPGQPANMQRIWGNHAALIYRDKEADNDYGVTFGFTAQFGTRVGGTIEDPDMGIRGGIRARVGESVQELIIASDLGYFFGNAVEDL